MTVCLGVVPKLLQPSQHHLGWIFRSAPKPCPCPNLQCVVHASPLGTERSQQPSALQMRQPETRVHRPHWLTCPMEGDGRVWRWPLLPGSAAHSLVVKPPSPHTCWILGKDFKGHLNDQHFYFVGLLLGVYGIISIKHRCEFVLRYEF